MKKLLEFFRKNKLNIASFAITLIIAGLLIKNKESEHLESYSYIATITSLVFIAMQAWIYISEVQRDDNRLKKQKSVELAEMYEREIVPLISTIIYVFSNLNMNEDIFSKIDDNKIKYFNNKELNNFLTEIEIKNYNDKLASRECLTHYGNLKFLKNEEKEIKVNLNIKGYSKGEIDKSIEEKVSDEVNARLNAKSLCELDTIISDLLNKLEAFSMYFNYCIADEEVVYQSLQQTYRSTVKLLYINIASLNNDSKNKYFTNIIELSNCWNARYFKKLKEEQRLEDLHESRIHRGKNI